MTYEEAYTITEESLRKFKILPEQENVSYMVKALLALEKQIPKKPKNQFEIDLGLGNCGTCQCGSEVNYQFEFCPMCGQAQDWSEEE